MYEHLRSISVPRLGAAAPPLAIKTRKFINAMLDVGEILSLEIHFISHSQLCTASDHEPKDDEGR